MGGPTVEYIVNLLYFLEILMQQGKGGAEMARTKKKMRAKIEACETQLTYATKTNKTNNKNKRPV